MTGGSKKFLVVAVAAAVLVSASADAAYVARKMVSTGFGGSSSSASNSGSGQTAFQPHKKLLVINPGSPPSGGYGGIVSPGNGPGSFGTLTLWGGGASLPDPTLWSSMNLGTPLSGLQEASSGISQKFTVPLGSGENGDKICFTVGGGGTLGRGGYSSAYYILDNTGYTCDDLYSAYVRKMMGGRIKAAVPGGAGFGQLPKSSHDSKAPTGDGYQDRKGENAKDVCAAYGLTLVQEFGRDPDLSNYGDATYYGDAPSGTSALCDTGLGYNVLVGGGAANFTRGGTGGDIVVDADGIYRGTSGSQTSFFFDSSTQPTGAPSPSDVAFVREQSAIPFNTLPSYWGNPGEGGKCTESDPSECARGWGGAALLEYDITREQCDPGKDENGRYYMLNMEYTYYPNLNPNLNCISRVQMTGGWFPLEMPLGAYTGDAPNQEACLYFKTETLTSLDPYVACKARAEYVISRFWGEGVLYGRDTKLLDVFVGKIKGVGWQCNYSIAYTRGAARKILSRSEMSTSVSGTDCALPDAP